MANSYNAQGVRMMNASRTEEALDFFEQAKNANPKNPDAYYNCGAVYHQTAINSERESDFQMAKYYYDLCLDLSPNHPQCLRAKAALLCDVGESDEAFRLVEAWVNRQPSSAEPRIELARLYDEHNQLARARDCLNDAVAIDNRNVRAYTALGSVRERMGDRDQAIMAYEHAIALDPYQPNVNTRLASLRYATPPSTAPTIAPQGENTLDPSGKEMIATQPDGTIQR